MSNKFKIQYYHKLPQNTTPYLQLIEAKKKIFGYKYEVIKHQKNPHNKSVGSSSCVPNSIPHHKNSKTQSSQKQRAKSIKQNSKKKRSRTQVAQDRLHQSLFINRQGQKDSKHQATKSLFAGQIPLQINLDHAGNQTSLNAVQMMKNNGPPQVQKQLRLFTQQIGRGQKGLDKLQIRDIDQLIDLIDSCIQQSGDYISYLTQKIKGLNIQMQGLKQQQIRILKIKDGIINEKELQIDRLRKQLYSLTFPKIQDKPIQIKKLLQVIQKLTQQNNHLKIKLHTNEKPQYLIVQKDREKKQSYHPEIHNKIDILNISIDKKHSESVSNEDPHYKRSKNKSKYIK